MWVGTCRRMRYGGRRCEMIRREAGGRAAAPCQAVSGGLVTLLREGMSLS